MNKKHSLTSTATTSSQAATSIRQLVVRCRWYALNVIRWPMPTHHLVPAVLLGLLAALLAMAVLARPWQTRIDVGGRFDSAFFRNFYATEYSQAHQTDFRWSRPVASLVLPGAGRPVPLELRLHGDYPHMPLQLDAGAGTTTLLLRPGWQRLVLLPRPALWSGDIQVQIATPAQTSPSDPRLRGVALDWIALRSPGGAPPVGQALLIGCSVALTTLLATWASQRLWPGIMAGLMLVAGCLTVLLLDAGRWHLLLTAYTGRLVLVLLLASILAVMLHHLLAWLAARTIVRLPPPTRRTLAAVAVLAFLLRFGAMAYPLNHNSDLPFILRRTWMVREGQLLTLFLPNLALTPVQWEMDITIPRSPFYYILSVPVTFLPGYQGDRLGMMAFSSSVDALAVVLVALLVCYAGGGGRAAIMAACLASTLPLGLLLIVSWGIFPTLLAQCLSLLVAVVWLRLRPRLHERRAQFVLAGCIALAWLSYPTALAFLGATLALLLLLLAIRRDAALRPTLTAMLLALGGVTLLYYGWHLPALLGKSLPTVLGETANNNTGGSAITLQRTLDAIWVPLHAKYGWLVLGMASGGALLLALGRGWLATVHARLLILAWCAAYIPFALADEYVVTLILKQLLHVLPMLALLGGVLLDQLSQRRAGLVVAWAILLFIGWQGLLTNLDVIVNAFPQLK